MKKGERIVELFHLNHVKLNCTMYIFRYHVIANPLEGKLTMPKAIFIVILIWCYAIPWALFPYFKVWGRFVPGKAENKT